MKIEKLQAGQIVWDVRRQGLGNTTARTTSVFQVRIVEVDPEHQWVLASWNGNPAQKYYRKGAGKWKKDKPVLVNSGFGKRLATRDEIKAMKQAANDERMTPSQVQMEAEYERDCGKER